ncbi:MAG: tetratricopeptide repeat protein [Burkholderiales bacterium]|nr:tetratricopeptide repeat protein [Burkholderiales bacterium]
MKNNTMKNQFRLLVGAAVVLLAAPLLAQETLPLSGPAYQLADDAYKAYRQGDYERAIRQAREALRLRPDAVRLQQLVRQAEQAQARRGKGLAAAPQVARRPRVAPPAQPAAPSPADPAFASADAAYKAYDRKDYPAAIGKAREAVQLAPANRAYRLLLVNSLSAGGRLEEAEAALDQGLQAVGNDAELQAQRAPIRRALAQAAGASMYRALQANDLPAALTAARAAVDYSPENPGYRLTLLNVLVRSERFAEAETVAGETIALLPDSAAPLALRAYARQRLGRWPDARADLDRALAQKAVTPQALVNLRLIAADAALAAGDPQRAAAALQGVPDAEVQAAPRRVAVRRALVRPVTAVPPAALTSASFPPPSVDCAAAETAQTCMVLPGQPPRDAAFDVAAAGYKALAARDFAAAADRARQAVATSPGNRDYQMLLLNAEMGAGRLPEAEAAASAALALDAGDGPLLAQRGDIRKRLGNAAGANEDFEAALRAGGLPPATEVGLLADLGRKAEARQRLAQAQAAGELKAQGDLDQAYLAVRLGDDAAAQAAFARADAAGKLPATSLQDSGYTAMRRGDDAQAVGYFKRSIDAVDSLSLKMDKQMVYDTRRTISELTRVTGLIASLAYRGGGSVTPGFGAAPTSISSKTLQAGVEAYWRPFGYRAGRYVELFARGFETLHSGAGDPTGGDSLQAALGIRWKPLSQANAVLSLSRVFTHGAPDDWLAQAAYSFDKGTDLRVDVPDWWTTRVSAEAGHYLSAGQTYGLATVQAGRSYRMPAADGKAVLFPHAVAAAEYNSLLADKLSVAAGPGVSLRYWFREDKYAAPRSYVDLSLQYRFRISGDERAKGLFVTSLISY